MPSLEFVVGQLDQAVRDFRAEVNGFRGDVKALRVDIDEIKLFRAKVLGASLLVSFIASTAFALLLHWGVAWAK